MQGPTDTRVKSAGAPGAAGFGTHRGPAFWVVVAALVGVLGYFGTWVSLDVGAQVAGDDFRGVIPNSDSVFIGGEGQVDEDSSTFTGPDVIGVIALVCLGVAAVAAFVFGRRRSREAAFAAFLAGGTLLVLTALKVIAISGLEGEAPTEEGDVVIDVGDPQLTDIASVGWGAWLTLAVAVVILAGAVRLVWSAPAGWTYLGGSAPAPASSPQDR